MIVREESGQLELGVCCEMRGLVLGFRSVYKVGFFCNFINL